MKAVCNTPRREKYNAAITTLITKWKKRDALPAGFSFVRWIAILLDLEENEENAENL